MELKEKAVKYGFKVKRKDDDVLVTEGYIVAVAVDKDFGKAINLPKEMAEKLQTFKSS